MKFPSPLTLKQVAELIGAKFIGPADLLLNGTNEIHRVQEGDIAFADHPKYFSKALESAATAAILNDEVTPPEGKGVLVVESPFQAFNELNKYFAPTLLPEAHHQANAKIGEGTHLSPGVFLGQNVEIGENCIIYPGVVLYQDIKIGNNVIIHANSSIGGDAFYYNRKPEGYLKMHTCGRVIIHDNVEIGATCTIDRGVTADTIIGKGTKIDNQVHIAHDTVIGENCLFAGQSAIAGCTNIGDEVKIWGNCSIGSGITIESGTEILARSGVDKDLKKGRYWGAPVSDAREKFKELAVLKRLARN